MKNNIKKIVAFLLVAVLCVSLFSGGKNVKKINAEAIPIELETLFNEYFDNQAAAEKKYKNKYLKFEGKVFGINSKSVEIHVSTSKKQGLMTIKMDDKDTVAEMTKGRTYTFLAKYDGWLFYDALIIE